MENFYIKPIATTKIQLVDHCYKLNAAIFYHGKRVKLPMNWDLADFDELQICFKVVILNNISILTFWRSPLVSEILRKNCCYYCTEFCLYMYATVAAY